MCGRVAREQEINPVTIAWCIHGFTAAGILLGIAAMFAVIHGQPRAALLWLTAALVVDGIDGPLARKYDVKRVLPVIDGHALDLMIDYVTCIFVPIAFMYEFDMFPHGLQFELSGMALVSSVIWMSRKDQCSADNWFNGFPGMWNLVAQGLFLLETPNWFNAMIVVVFSVLGLTRVKFVHPVQVVDRRNITLPVTVAWLALQLGLVIAAPGTPGWGKLLVLAAPAWYTVLSIERTREDSPKNQAGMIFG